MNLNQYIKKIAKSSINPLEHVIKYGAKRIENYTIECEMLKELQESHINKEPEFKELFQKLNEHTGPCLYFFTITSKHANEDLINDLKIYKQKPNSRALPAIKKKMQAGNILYAGKVKRYFASRVEQHLGYYKVEKTQGLQLLHWTKFNKLKLILTVMEFEKDMDDMMTIFEFCLARELKPIVGKH